MMISYDGRILQKKWKNKWLATGVMLSSDKTGGAGMKTMQANMSLGYPDFGEYTIGINYDMNYSGLKTATSDKGGFEISLHYGLNPSGIKTAASFN